MNVSYDPKADALYIHFSDKKSTRSEEIRDDIVVDYAGKTMIGLEVLDVSKKLGSQTSSTLTVSLPSPLRQLSA